MNLKLTNKVVEMTKKKLSFILKVINMFVGVAMLGYLMFRFSNKQYAIDDDVREYCVSMHYDFKILNANEDSFYNFDGMTREGKRVAFKIPKVWNLRGVYSVGDSICKVSGDSILHVVTPRGVVSLNLE